MFLPIWLCFVLTFGGGYVAAKGNVPSTVVQALMPVAPAAAPAAK